MAQEFYRNQNPGERVAKLNVLADRVETVTGRVDAIEEVAAPGTFDPGDLTVYYENGKA